ncbi:hypothetical protein DFJ74DRAFT_297077 [Hyaloraphidium curvatum]|nr:hypothetical protein DFJ74DRAFT_297077 [Hyaloraphidium curvatum]
MPWESRRSRSYVGPGTRTFGTALALAAALVATASLGASATSSSSFTRTEVIDPGTGFLVCRERSRSLSGPSESDSVAQCIGRCPGGNFSSYSRYRRQPAPYKCAAVGSCIRSPSNGCNWVGVDYSYNASSGSSNYNLSCRGPSNGTCTWYSDPLCTAIISPGMPPQKGGGVACNPSGEGWEGTWCRDAHDYLVKQIKPVSCPDVTEKQEFGLSTAWGPPWAWTCIKSCDDWGLYVQVRRTTADNFVECLGTYPSAEEPVTCTFYSDVDCSIVAPGSKRPDTSSNTPVAGGLRCNAGIRGWCKAAMDVLVRNQTAAAECLGPPWFGPWTCLRSCNDGGLYLQVRRANDTVVCLGTDDFFGAPATCSFFTDANCGVLAPGSNEPHTNPYLWEDSEGIICTSTATGWCKVAADVVLNNQTAPTQCTATGITATGTATSTPTPGPWTCFTSCPDKAHSVLVRLTPERQTVQCQGPNATMCSWFDDGACMRLAPGEPMPGIGGLQGYVCTQTAEGWCGEAWRVLNGGAPEACPAATAPTASSTGATVSPTGPISTPFTTSFSRVSAAMPVRWSFTIARIAYLSLALIAM